MQVRDWNGVARFGLPGLIVGVAVSWLAGARGPELAAQTAADVGALRADGARGLSARPAAGGEAGGTMAFVTNVPGTQQGQWLFLVDTKTQAMAVYRVDPSNPKGVLKLEAARRYEWDLKLEQYNNQAPEPGAIEAMVKASSPAGRPPKDR